MVILWKSWDPHIGSWYNKTQLFFSLSSSCGNLQIFISHRTTIFYFLNSSSSKNSKLSLSMTHRNLESASLLLFVNMTLLFLWVDLSHLYRNDSIYIYIYILALSPNNCVTYRFLIENKWKDTANRISLNHKWMNLL